MQFQIGDRVEVVKSLKDYSNYHVGDTATYKSGSYLDPDEVKGNGMMYKEFYKLKKIGGDPMSLRTRIEALENGWDKEADDILQEIIGRDNGIVNITICGWSEDVSHGIKINTDAWKKTITKDKEKTFSFTDQCSKMTAFKDALLWLLDKSGLEGHKKGDVLKVEIDGRTYKAKVLEEL